MDVMGPHLTDHASMSTVRMTHIVTMAASSHAVSCDSWAQVCVLASFLAVSWRLLQLHEITADVHSIDAVVEYGAGTEKGRRPDIAAYDGRPHAGLPHCRLTASC